MAKRIQLCALGSVSRDLSRSHSQLQVNQQLSSIYQKLTRHGDAYLSYTEDKSVLFADGVTLIGKYLRRTSLLLDAVDQHLFRVFMSYCMLSLLYPAGSIFQHKSQAELGRLICCIIMAGFTSSSFFSQSALTGTNGETLPLSPGVSKLWRPWPSRSACKPSFRPLSTSLTRLTDPSTPRTPV